MKVSVLVLTLLVVIAGLVGYLVGASHGGGTMTVVKEVKPQKTKSTLEKIEAESGLGDLQKIEEEVGLTP